jgi:hypothetical protein
MFIKVKKEGLDQLKHNDEMPSGSHMSVASPHSFERFGGPYYCVTNHRAMDARSFNQKDPSS